VLRDFTDFRSLWRYRIKARQSFWWFKGMVNYWRLKLDHPV